MARNVFFASYARMDNDDEQLSEVMAKLVSRVRKKFGEADVDAFFDRNDLENGQQWQERLGAALRELRVMICMCSPGYVKSAFCAKEFAVFRQRLEELGPNPCVGILPLIWEPTPLPQTITRIHQAKPANIPADYENTGLWKYSQLKAQHDNFIQIIDAIAEQIHAAHKHSKLEEWPKEVKFDELPDSFDDPHTAPYGAVLTTLDHKRSRWKPGDVDGTIGTIFGSVANTLRVCWRDVPFDAATFLDNLTQAAADRQVVLYAMDFASTTSPRWAQLLAEIDASKQTNFALLIGRKKDEIPASADARQYFEALMPASTAAGAPHAFFPLDDAEACGSAFVGAFTTVQLALMKQDKAAEVVADDLRDAARNDGIDVDRPPPLTGPGGQQS